MALVSPGVQVTVIDESQYIPSAVNTVPYFLIATAQNKVSSDGITVAAGTTAANANKTYLITSQRDLTATFGVPFFYNTTNGTPINGYELNEYGLLAAYSALGVSNRCYVQRVDVDLTQLAASLTRPTGEPTNGAFWEDASKSTWGIQEWNQSTGNFTVKTPMVITESAQVIDPLTDNYTPVSTVGSIGEYAVSAVGEFLQIYYKTAGLVVPTGVSIVSTVVDPNQWVLVGSDNWKLSNPAVVGTAKPTSLNVGDSIYINGVEVAVTSSGYGATLVGLTTNINNAGITGVYAKNTGGVLSLYADSTATNDGSTNDGNGIISIEPGVNGTALLAALGITPKVYQAPTYLPAYSYQAPRWRTTDAVPAPTGSVWQNISPVNNGMNIVMKKYSSTLGTWVAQTTNVYLNDAQAIYALDPSGGGKNIPVGTTYAVYNAQQGSDLFPTASFEIVERLLLGQTVVTGSTPNPTFNIGDRLLIQATYAGSNAFTATFPATLLGTTVNDFINAVSAANCPHVSAGVDSSGNLVLTHDQGGSIVLFNAIGTPVTDAGFTNATPLCRPGRTTGFLVLSNFVNAPEFTYVNGTTAPFQDPANGTLWYYSTATQVDIMVQDNGQWMGYQNVTNDVRGFDLSITNATGPIFSTTAPTTQTDAAASPLVYGDLWIDTSDLENYPVIYRWEPVNGVDQWVLINNTDQVTQNGVLFADARWAPNGSTDPIADPIPSIQSLLTSDYLDLDAPDATLYPQGVLLFNTRRSGYNVKSYNNNYFNATNFPDAVLPTVASTWISASGNRDNGAMWAGRLAQRQMIVKAMKAGIDTSQAAREEQNGFNIVAAPSYPELMPNMIALSNERNNTVFVVGDTPMRLDISGNSLVTWATNNGGLGVPTEDGLVATSNYCAAFYPSCQTNDLSGNTVVAPPSHMMVRTILRSDSVSYPWLAPAGTRRGVVDNASAIGYIDAATGEFVQVGVSQAVRDILYEHNINPITFIPGVGITNFGNKTTTTTTSALDRINVARLICFLRERLAQIGKLYLFEPNDTITRNEITNTINSLMIDLISKRAIYDYLVVCDLTNNTPARIDRNELWVDVAIEPVKAVEFIYIPLRIKNTGEIAAGA